MYLFSNFPSVQLVFENKSHICSGTFIDNYTILTAAHCIKEPENKWKGFSLKLEQIFDSKGEEIEFKLVKNIPHPQFIYSKLKSKHDIGVIKVEYNDYFKSFPKVGKTSNKKSYLYGCGRTNLKDKTRKCLQGENEVFSFLNFLISWGESSNKQNDGNNVTVAPNDSGGALVDAQTNRIIGVHWGTWVTLMAKMGLPSPSFITSLEVPENYDFVMSNLSEITQSQN